MGQLERKPGKQNWIEHLPAPMRAAWNRSLIYRAAVHMAKPRGTMSVGHAIASAINWAEHICRTGDVKQWRGPQQVSPKSRAEACAAIVLWNSMKAAARADLAVSEAIGTIDLARHYAAKQEGMKPHIPKGAVRAYLDLSEVR